MKNTTDYVVNALKRALLTLLLVLPTGVGAQESWQTAKPLEQGIAAKGSLSETIPEEWYAIAIAENGVATISVTKDESLSLGYITLYTLNSEGEVMERAYIWDKGDLTVKDLAAGTYYLKLSNNGGEGQYTVVYTFAPTSALYKNDVEPNDTWQQAQPLRRGNITTGHLGYQYCQEPDGDDWWMLDVPKQGAVKISITAHDELALSYTTLYTLNNDELAERSNCWGNGEIIVSDAGTGTYYLCVSNGGGQGAYSLHYKLELPPYAADAEPNNEWATALPLEAGATVAGNLGYKHNDDVDTEDWYCVTLPKKGDLTFTYYVQAGLDLGYVMLYNSEEGELGSLWGNGEDGHQQLTVSDLEAGIYYLRLCYIGGSGYYLLAYANSLGTVEQQEQLPDEPSDDPHAQPVPDDGTGVKYTYDPETNTLTVVAPSPTPPYVFKCAYPDETVMPTLTVLFPCDIFSGCGEGDISVGAKTPPTVVGGSFDVANVGNRTLHVPEGSEKAYEKDANWGLFGTIVGNYGKPDNTSGPRLVVWLRSGERVIYQLADVPVTTFSGGQLVIRTNNVTVPYDRNDVLRYTYEALDTGLDLQASERLVQIDREGNEVSFRGLPTGATASIYSVNGQLVGQVTASDNQPLTISLRNRPSGVYIVKAGTETIKILKK